MQALRARVEKGRIKFDEPTDLPEGREVQIMIVESANDAADDEMDANELAALDAGIEESFADEAAGRVRDLAEAFPQLRIGS